MSATAIRVLVVDDSAVVRMALSAALGTDPLLEISAVADPIFAQQRMRMAWPDVIILDVEMPRMDGITFLKAVMAQRPTPVIVCSTLTTRGAETTVQALAAGAFSVIAKPRLGFREHAAQVAAELVQTVRAAARANVRNLGAPMRPELPVVPLPAPTALAETTEFVAALGTSTGGTIALEHVLAALPVTCPGLVIVQHMPEKFTSAFAKRLDSICAIEVREAEDMDRVLPGRALIAPGGRHMQLKRSGANYYVQVRDGPAVNRHKPSVDVLFRSVAQVAGANAVGVIMTGMGDDGAAGLKAMREAGAWTVAQDEASCVVFGMPKEALRMGSVERTVALDAIAAEVMRRSRERRAVAEIAAPPAPRELG